MPLASWEVKNLRVEADGWKRSSESAAFAPRRARLFLGKSAVEGAWRDDEQVASSQRPFRSLRCLGELRIGVPPRGENG